MAEALFRQRIGTDSGWVAVSAGIFAGVGLPASAHAIEALDELDIDLRSHGSNPVTREGIDEANMIVAMTENHRFHLLQNFPEIGNKVSLLKSFGTTMVRADIIDPFGGSLDIYRETRDEIDRSLTDLVLFLRTGNP